MGHINIEIDEDVFLPCYHHILDNYETYDIDFLYGGRDSGKSRFIAQFYIILCLSLPYFRCVLIRKVFNTIKDSIFQLIKDIIIEWGLEEYFVFKISPLEIDCINGNKFIARGFDEPAKLRSLTNPSHALIDEGNQLDDDDFVTLLTTLRYNGGNVKVFFAFNPETIGNYEDNWLYKNWFSHTNELSWINEIKIKVGEGYIALKVRATHTTYKDNQYCSLQRQAFLEQLILTNPHYYQVFTLGKWGNLINDNPFAFAFGREKHLGIVQRTPGIGIIASFDFNRNPITCFVCQILPGDKLRGIEQIKLPNSDIYKLCEYLLLHYPNTLWTITGDATGTNSSAMVQDNLNYYTVIRQRMNLSPGQFKVPRVNPTIKENQNLVNAVLALCDCKFDKDKCKALVFDFENVRMLATGDVQKVAMDKTSRNNPTMQADALDCFRYVCNTFMKHILKQLPPPKK